MSDYEEDTTCPLCMDPLDATDQAINFCQCGYKMCLWCWNQLMETANREALPGRCPNCRTEYDKDKITMAQLDPDVVQREQQRRKEQTKKKATADALHRPPRALGQVRVVQRNLVYAVGMPLSICREEVLADRHYFGQFGRIKKVSVNRSTPFSQVQKNGPSGSAYVTFYRPEDALRCIEAVDGSVWEGKPIKACFGTTKYCNAFLKGVPCNNPDCLYLHDVAEPGDSFSKEDMMANGLQSGRNTFFDLVHPTNTKEASAHAHAALQSMCSGNSGAAGSSGGAMSSSCAAMAAGVAAPRPASQPMAITGARRTSSATPWGSGGGDGPATASPSKPGAAAMAAAAARWGSLPRATPPSAIPLNSPLADVEWPSLGAATDAADAPKHAAADNGHGAAVQTPSSSRSAAGPHPQHPSASASAHPVSHPVCQVPAAAPTAAAVVAGKVPAAVAAVAAAAAKQQQQQAGKQQQQQKAMVSLPKNAKAAAQTPVKAGTAAAAAPATPPAAAAPAAKSKQSKADAAAAAETQNEAAAANSLADKAAEQQQQQQPEGRDSKQESKAKATVAPAVVTESTSTSSSKAAPQANGKLTKQEAKKAAKAAAKQAAKEAEAEAAAAKAAKAEAAAAAKAAKNEAGAAAKEAAAAGQIALANGEAGSPVKAAAVDRQAAAVAGATAVASAPGVTTPSPGPKVPPPGFTGATPARVKGPPPGFQGVAASAQQRPPPPGFEPSLLALARAGSSSSLNQTGQGSSGGGAPPGMHAIAAVLPGLSRLGMSTAACAAAATAAGSERSGALSPAAIASTNGGGMGSRRSSDLDGAASAAKAPSEELALSTGSASRPQSRAGSVQATAAAVTPVKPAVSDAAAAAAAPSPIFSPPLVAPQQQQQQSLFGTPGSLSPLLGFQTHTPPQQLFGASVAVGSSSSVFDVNAFFDPVGPYSGPAVSAAGSVNGGGSLFGASLAGTPIAQSPLAAATTVSGGLGGSVASSADGTVPLSARKQSRFSFAQQPQQQQQLGARAPPGFAGLGGSAAAAPVDLAAAAPARAAVGGLGAFGGSGGFAGQHAASFFKNLLPGVNVHVAASPPTPLLGGVGTMGCPPAVGVAGVAPFPMQAAPGIAAPNPGLALLQQLQRGSQQH